MKEHYGIGNFGRVAYHYNVWYESGTDLVPLSHLIYQVVTSSEVNRSFRSRSIELVTRFASSIVIRSL